MKKWILISWNSTSWPWVILRQFYNLNIVFALFLKRISFQYSFQFWPYSPYWDLSALISYCNFYFFTFIFFGQFLTFEVNILPFYIYNFDFSTLLGTNDGTNGKIYNLLRNLSKNRVSIRYKTIYYIFSTMFKAH